MEELVIRGIRFQPLRKLGKGSFGVVYEIDYKGERKALKVIQEKAKYGIKDLKELDILTRLRHPGLVHADEVISEYRADTNTVDIFIVMPLADSDLYKAILKSNFSAGEKIHVMTEVTRGLAFLHSQNYLHMDIKPLNILIFDNFKSGKLSDFGLSLRLEGDASPSKTYPIPLMTVDHRSVNILGGSQYYTPADDIWSLGITMLETFSGKSPFAHLKKDEYTAKKVLKIVQKTFGSENIDATLELYFRKVPPLFRNKLISIVRSMLKFDPKKRPTAQNVLEQLSRNDQVGGEILNTPVLPPNLCDALIIHGFNAMVKLCARVWVRLETFFLAADLYQRSLAYRTPLTGDLTKDINNSVFQGVLAVYMAIKVVENFSGKPEKLTELSGNLFLPDDLVIGESHLITAFGGHIYRDNLFTATTTQERFQVAFDLTRNCNVYRNIDISEWKSLNDEEAEAGAPIYPQKWGYFIDFLERTPYHDTVYADPPVDVEQIFQSLK